MTSVGQCAPAQTRPAQARKMARPDAPQSHFRHIGLTRGETHVASMKHSHVKKTA